MSDLVINVSPRLERGKKNNKIRREKQIPAIVYGNKQKNLSLSLDIRLAEKYSKREFENKIFTFDSEDKNLKGLKVIKKAVSYHKVKRLPIHMDFLSLDMTKPLRIPIDLKFTGSPKGVKEEGGIFNIILRQIEIECLPSDIPSFIELDVSGLSLNQNFHVSDLKLSEKLKLITRTERTVCTVAPAEAEEEKKTEEQAQQENEKAADDAKKAETEKKP